MRKSWSFVLLIFMTNLIIMSDVPSALAAIYYVDFNSGLDSNDGSRTLSPLKHSPGDSNYNPSGVAPRSLSAGDTVYFKGGVQYNGTINVNWNGSLNNPITYDGNTSGNWGSGKSIIDGENIRYKGFIAGSNRSYVTINNFEIRNLKAHPTDDYGTIGVDLSSGSINFTVKNCYFHENGYWNNDGGILKGIAVQAWLANGCVIDNNEITKNGYMGIDLVSTTNCIISNNNVHHFVNWGVHVNPYYGNVTGTIIRGNTIHDIYQYGTPFWKGPPHPTDHPHTDGLFITADGASYTISGTIIEQNRFYNDISFTESDGTADVYIENGSSTVTNTIVRNNIFINSQAYISLYNGGATTEAYNNTFYSQKAETSGVKTQGLRATLIFKNNIVVSLIPITWDSTTNKLNFLSDYNYFVTSTSDGFRQVTPYATQNFSAWKSSSGNDLHSTLAIAVSSVKFVNITGYPTYSSAMNFKLQPGSPAINSGTTILGFTTDYAGVTRIAPWDIGAYQDTSDTSIDPNPPSNIIIR